MREFVDRWLVQLLVGIGLVAAGAVGVALFSIVAAETARDDAALAREDARVARAELATSEADVERLRVTVVDFLGQAQGLQAQLVGAGPAMSRALGEAIGGLETFGTSTIELSVPIRDEVSIDSSIELDRTLRVPVSTTVSIDEIVETTITVDTPVGVDIPVDVRVPLQLELPIELDLSVPLRQTIPINIDVPVALDVPVTLDVASSELGTLAESLTRGLRSLETLLSSFGG